MNIVLCEQKGNRGYDAGNKARSDTLAIALDLGFKHVKLFDSGSNKLFVFFQMIKGSIRMLLEVKNGDKVLIQYPYYPIKVNSILLSFLSLGSRIRGYKVVVLIHDLIRLRELGINKPDSMAAIKKEIEELDKADYIILHNQSMKNVVKPFLKKSKTVDLGIFDYLYGGKLASHSSDKTIRVMVAGNLKSDKSGYIYKIPKSDNYTISLYGVGYNEKENRNNLQYNGKYSPDELIEHLVGEYGLVWDGNSIEECTGSYGQYLKYNNPHKASLYIAAGVPLIVWNEAAIASFVKENDIGFCLNSLNELNEVLMNTSAERYAELVHNVKKIRKKVIQGGYLRAAIKECIDDI